MVCITHISVGNADIRKQSQGGKKNDRRNTTVGARIASADGSRKEKVGRVRTEAKEMKGMIEDKRRDVETGLATDHDFWLSQVYHNAWLLGFWGGGN